MRRRIMQFAMVAVVCAVAGGVAFAEYSDRIYDDYDQGHALISRKVDDFSTAKWDAEVDYAVYAPGKYPGDHPDEDTHYIYAYQLFNDTDSDVVLANFSVGLGENSGAANPRDDDSYGMLNGVMPVLCGLDGTNPTSVQWGGTGGDPWVINPSEHSTVLLFSSPNTYTWDSATVVGGGQGNTQSLPSPLPEPAVLILLCGGVVPILLKHRRKVRAKI